MIEVVLMLGELEFGGLLELVDFGMFEWLLMVCVLLWFVVLCELCWEDYVVVLFVDFVCELFVFYVESFVLYDVVFDVCW